MNRRDFMYALGGFAALKTTSITTEWASFYRSPEKYIQPRHDKVRAEADSITGIPDSAELTPELTYERDGEILKPAAQYLEQGVGDCEDHSFLAASILENKDIPWKLVFEPGHTEAAFHMDDTYYRWHVGNPETPEPRNSKDFELMYDLEDGWEAYEDNWNN